MMMNYEMTTAIYELMNAIKADYYRWTSRNGTRELTEVNKRMIDEFNAELSYEVGRKYIKIVKGGSVWGFVVKEDDTQFKAGDILKAASWATPARNKARGNVLTQNFSWVQWTGPAYL
jgi:hypothetical protein